MAQNLEVSAPVQRWTRADFTALRAHLNRIPVERVLDLYYTEDDLYSLRIETPGDLRRRIEELRDTLIQRASVANPHIAELLRNARKSSKWSNKLVDHLVQAAETDSSRPRKADSISSWMKPRVAGTLKAEGMSTLDQLIDRVEMCGFGWWKPIPKIGAGKAKSIVLWLQKHESSLGYIDIEQDLPVLVGELIEIRPETKLMVPLERVSLPPPLSGASGINRNAIFPLISARNDLESIEAYLYKFRGKEKTQRAYQKELERFLLWCIYERRKPMSSVLMDDCEAYKDFLSATPGEWVGQTKKRLSGAWRPFAKQISPQSQKYAIQIVRSFFEWLVKVRYLAGNPWITVSDPLTDIQETAIQIAKAVPEAVWEKLILALCDLGSSSDEALRSRFPSRGAMSKLSISAQFRALKAGLLLLGDAGLRREEACTVSRSKLRPIPGKSIWELEVLGKRKKWRTVFLTERTICAIKDHWRDRGLIFDGCEQNHFLLSPIVIPQTPSSTSKFSKNGGSGFSPNGLYQLLKAGLARIARDQANGLNDFERSILLSTSPHAFRHTFGVTRAKKISINVLQRALGHVNLQTTTIYVQSEKHQSINEFDAYSST